MVIYYSICLGLSIMLSLLYAFKWHKHFNINITLIFLLTPFIMIGYLTASLSKELNEAYLANKIIYLGGCFLLLLILYAIFALCKIKLPIWLRFIFLAISATVYLSVLSIGYLDIFYKSAEIAFAGDVAYLTNKQYGFMHTIFLIMIVTYFAISVATIIYTYIKNKQVSRKTIILLGILESIAVIGFLTGRLVFKHFEVTPISYIFAQAIFVIIISRIHLYDVSETTVDSMIEKGDIGFISFDFKYNYLGSNETAKMILPEINDLVVDKKVKEINFCYIFIRNIDKIENKENDHFFIERNNHKYLVTPNYLYDGKKKRGYHFTITDDTKNQEYIKLINQYNTELKAQVEEKTKHIVEMHDQFILGLATMIESRDNTTGGHIKRTSQGVKILVEEMMKDNIFNMSDEFCKKLIKAAPMHDLGKIAVDDSILRKPGKLTPEEFAEMKKHPLEGAKIIAEILNDTDDVEFKKIAINVAHYHHERWDGKGYPEGLKGEEIPLEARIMAIADFYDALESKRSYKEKMPPEEAYQIIVDGMGTIFDKRLEKYFINAREKLEEYYKNVE